MLLTGASCIHSDSGELTLKICNLMPQDSGIYTCVATNEHGTASTSATIKVQGSTFDLNTRDFSCVWSLGGVWEHAGTAHAEAGRCGAVPGESRC